MSATGEPQQHQEPATEINEEAHAKMRAMRGIKDDEVSTEPIAMYLEDNFRKYVAEKYAVEDKDLLENATVMQMIYALEWYDVPRSAKADLVEFHPYLTEDDYEKLYYIKSQHMIEMTVGGLLFTMVSNRILHNQGPSIFKKRYVRFPTATVFGGMLCFALNALLLKQLLSNDLKEESLEKYYTLDLNAEMMKQDLAGMGIRIQAAHFDMDATQKRIDQAAEDATRKV